MWGEGGNILMAAGAFYFFNKQLPYCMVGPHLEGERVIEIPIALEFLKLFDPGDVVEIGAVLPYHIAAVSHQIIDPYDPWPLSLRRDAEEVDVTGKVVLSISTIEHIGKQEYGDHKKDPGKAMRVFDKITAQAADYLISFPVGYHKKFDQHVRLKTAVGDLTGFMFMRFNSINDWTQISGLRWRYRYNYPFPYGNAVVFIASPRYLQTVKDNDIRSIG